MVELISAGLTEVDTSSIVDKAVTAAKLADEATWKFLGEPTLTGAGTSLAVDSLPAMKWLKGSFSIEPAAAQTHLIHFNDDTAANYAYRWGLLSTAYSTTAAAGTTGCKMLGNTEFIIAGNFWIKNVPGEIKQMWWTCLFNAAPEGILTGTGHWTNAVDSIAKIDLVYGANMEIGSKMAIFGCDV